MSSSSASNKNTHDKTMAQYNADARLTAEFEKSGKFFNYSKSVRYEPKTPSSDDQMTAYLTKIQRGGLVQSFGCMLAIAEPTCKIIGYSENCVDMLGLKNLDEAKDCMSLIGIDARTLFTPSSRASLNEAFESREMSLSNPIWLHSWTSSRPFYAILHRIDVGIVIDLEPAPFGDPVTIHAGVVQSQKLAVKAISRLQSLPGGDIGILCDAVVEDVQRLTGYDRVMAYKFHDDDHGEVISEIRRSDLEPYLGLHYPATDIPQAARFLFRQNRVRMICDCKCQPVKVIQSEELKQPLCLVNSTLRSPHGCHAQYMANMGSISSLVFAVIVNNGDSMKLWGLVVCHHTSPRYVPFPLRYACEFLIQTFSLQLHMELQIASQLAEKKILRVQTSLSDMILHDTPLGVMTRSPNIMDLVKCDGAALYYGRKFWLLGVTPTESQLQNIVEWLLKILGDSMGLSTDSLVDAGYPGATFLGDAVCGMVTARITSSDFLFWFRSHTAIEFGAKHHTEDKDDGGKMHPRSSFNAFLEVVKSRSRPWEALEINAIHSLQLIMRDSLQEIEEKGHKYNPKQLTMRDSLQEIEESGHKPDDARVDESGHKPNVCDDARVAERTSVAVEMARLIETATAPIFGVSLLGLINGWNAKMCELTGLEVSDALGKSLIDIVHEDSREVAKTLIVRGIQGTEDKNVEVKLLKFDAHSPHTLVYLLVNTCTSRDYKNDVVGVCFVGQDITGEKTVMNKFIRLHWDYKAIIQSVNPFIPPIFASDDNACCSEWNAVMENLTGYMKHEIIGKMLAGEIFGGFCKLKDPEILTKFMILLYRAIGGHNTEKLAFGFFNRKGEFVEVNLTASKRSDEKGSIIGCLCLLQTVVINHKESIVNKQEERKQVSKELAYIMRETKNSLDGIRFTHQILRGSAISDDQKRYLDTSDACERQILSIIDDGYFGSFEVGNGSLKVEEFLLGNLVNAIICQAMLLSRKNNLHFIQDIPEQIKTLYVYGDQMKLQLALSDLLLSVVDNAPTPDGWVEIKVSLGLKFIQDGNEYVHIEFRMAHSGNGLPLPVIEDMFDVTNHWKTHEGFALNISQKLVNMMKGNVRYIREQNRYYFQIELELKSRAKSILLPDRT